MFIWLLPEDGEMQLVLDEMWEGTCAQAKPQLRVGCCGCMLWEASEPCGGNRCQGSTPVSPVGVRLVEGFHMLQMPDPCAWLRTIMHFAGTEGSQPRSLTSFSARFKCE